MATLESQKQALYSRLYSIESDISMAMSAINEARNNVSRVESGAASLSSRLARVRERGYAAMAHMEKDVDDLNKRWNEVSPGVKQTLASGLEPLTSQVNGLQQEARGLRSQIDSGNMVLGQSTISRLSPITSSLRARASSEADRVNTPLRDLLSCINITDGDLKIAEQTVDLFSEANFPMKEDESPVLAVEGKILTGDKNEGTLFFSNQRFVFEAKKEIVLEKKLFIVTKKKIEKVVVINQPIGALKEVSKGRVGLIAWTGLFFRFKPDSREEDTQFDVEGWEADAVTKYYDYIIDGEADKDIAAIKGTSSAAKPSLQLAICSHCHAPYKREIFKGQKSVQCDYCGAQIVLE